MKFANNDGIDYWHKNLYSIIYYSGGDVHRALDEIIRLAKIGLAHEQETHVFNKPDISIVVTTEQDGVYDEQTEIAMLPNANGDKTHEY